MATYTCEICDLCHRDIAAQSRDNRTKLYNRKVRLFKRREIAVKWRIREVYTWYLDGAEFKHDICKACKESLEAWMDERRKQREQNKD